jgi:hypothetical protein
MAPNPASIRTPEEVVAEAAEMGGAAYRVQPHAWAPQQDGQLPYWAGFNKARHDFGQTGYSDSDTGIVDAPVTRDARGGTTHREMRPRAHRESGGEGGPKANRQNVLKRTPHAETTGEDPAPLFTHGQLQSRR